MIILLKKFISKLINSFNRNFHRLETACRLSKIELNYPVIFIIGAPRSGSTLLYQVLCDHYDIGYLSNIHCKFFGFPSLLEFILRPSRYHELSNYDSYHGRTFQWNNPCECGHFWYRFFPLKPQYVSIEDMDQNTINYLRKTICILVDTFSKPILFKNLICTLRLQVIARVFPEALFIVISRNLIDNSHSLLKGRKKTYGNYNTWWSAEPPEINDLINLPPEKQVVEQIKHIYEFIEKNKQAIGLDRFVNIRYENLCDDTHKTINDIDDFLKYHGLSIPLRQNISNMPKNFSIQKNVDIDTDLYQRLLSYIRTKK